MIAERWSVRASVLSLILAWTAFAFAGVQSVGAQRPSPPPCPERFEDIEAIVTHLDSIASGDRDLRGRSRSIAISEVLLPSLTIDDLRCPRLDPAVDRRAAMVRLLEYVRDHPDGGMGLHVLTPVSIVARRWHEEVGWSPTELLFEIVERGRTNSARVGALGQLLRRWWNPGVRERLLALARSPVGPPAWPDLPAHLVSELQYMSGAGVHPLRSELLAEPSRLAHPRARWEAECGQGHPIPRSRDDLCHLSNRPPLIADTTGG